MSANYPGPGQPHGMPGLPPPPQWPAQASPHDMPPGYDQFGRPLPPQYPQQAGYPQQGYAQQPPQPQKPPYADKIMAAVTQINASIKTIRDENEADPTAAVAQGFEAIRDVLEVLCNVTRSV